MRLKAEARRAPWAKLFRLFVAVNRDITCARL
jgi:hypothetical protein